MFKRKIDWPTELLNIWNPESLEFSVSKVLSFYLKKLFLKEISVYFLSDSKYQKAFSLEHNFDNEEESSFSKETHVDESFSYQQGHSEKISVDSLKNDIEKRNKDVFFQLTLSESGQKCLLVMTFTKLIPKVIYSENFKNGLLALGKLGLIAYNLSVDKKLRSDEERKIQAQELSFSASMSVENLVKIVLSQCAKSVGFSSAFLVDKSSSGELRYSMGWQTPSQLKNIDLKDSLLKSVDLEGSIFYEPVGLEKLKALGLMSIFHMPFDKQILILVSEKRPQKLNLEAVQKLESYINLLKEVKGHSVGVSKIREAYENTLITARSCIELSDSYLLDHHKKVESVASILSKNMNLSSSQCSLISKSAMYHDIGLLGGLEVDNDVMLEFQHPDIGASMALLLEEGESLAKIISQHHEHFDGYGFPRSLEGDEICIEAQVLSCAEFIVEQVTSNSISPGVTWSDLHSRMEQEKNKRFSVEMVEVFFNSSESLEALF